MSLPEARDRLIVALDVDSAGSALDLAGRLQGRVGLFKIGLELFSSAGPSIVREVAALGHRIFLDLKLHDIPNTVAGACRSCAGLGIDMLTLHASGGAAMLEAARDAVGNVDGRPRLLAVTVLTSLDRKGLSAVGVDRPVADQVQKLVDLAAGCGIDGIVCSGQDLDQLSHRPADLFFVTPGIRPDGSAAQDQSRVLTPAAAIRKGARYLVVGRPVTQAPDPAAAADRIVAEIAQGLSA